MNEILFDLKNYIFDAVYKHFISQWHTNHIMYHITDCNTTEVHIENTQAPTYTLSVSTQLLIQTQHLQQHK
jgi:hypothetical protein